MADVSLKIVELTVKKIDEQDAKTVRLMADGMLPDYAEYQHAAGYRKALRDAKTLLQESLEDVMKE